MRRLSYGVLRIANTLIAVLSNLLFIACWLNSYDVTRYSLLAPWLSIVTFLSAVDLGIASVAYADARRLFLQDRGIDAERRLSTWLTVSVYVSMLYVIAMGSAIVLFGPVNNDTRLLLVGLLIVLVLNIPWRLVVSRGTALANPVPAEILDVIRKLFQMAAWALGTALTNVSIAIMLLLLTWIIFFPLGLAAAKRWCVEKRRASIPIRVLIAGRVSSLMRSGVFVFIDQLSSTIIVVALGVLYPGAAIVASADLAARLVRAASSAWWMFASVMLPDITRLYWTGRTAFVRSINVFLGWSGLLGVIVGGGTGALVGPLLLSQTLGYNVPFMINDYGFVFAAMGGAVLQSFSTCWTLSVGRFSEALIASVVALASSIGCLALLVSGAFNSGAILVSVNALASAAIGYVTWLHVQRFSRARC